MPGRLSRRRRFGRAPTRAGRVELPPRYGLRQRRPPLPTARAGLPAASRFATRLERARRLLRGRIDPRLGGPEPFVRRDELVPNRTRLVECPVQTSSETQFLHGVRIEVIHWLLAIAHSA